MKIEIVVQARLSSTRMPGKVLEDFTTNENILSLQVKNLKKLKYPLLLATSRNAKDNLLAVFSKKIKTNCFRGSEDDVLGRFINASSADYFIRVCSDNPFLDTQSITTFLEHVEDGTDYISFKNTKGTPAVRTHWGLFAEVVSRKALVKAHDQTENHPKCDFYREHVTNYVYENPKKFKVKLLEAPEIIKDRNDLRFTIDTPEDFVNMQRLYQIIERDGGDFSLESLVKTTDKHPEIKKVMGESIKKFSK
jgi:spore coat polysaccharide biosynthesis protein SpsF